MTQALVRAEAGQFKRSHADAGLLCYVKAHVRKADRNDEVLYATGIVTKDDIAVRYPQRARRPHFPAAGSKDETARIPWLRNMPLHL